MNSAEDNPISVCLPKGEALEPLASLFVQIGFKVEDYHARNRTYRPVIKASAPIRSKIMAEKDVALQVAAGNYDLGFCGLDWIREHQARFPGTWLQVVKQLGINVKRIRACVALNTQFQTLADLLAAPTVIRMVSEYPNLAESFAIKHRLKRFNIFSAWGAVEAYPPEHADLVLIAVAADAQLTELGLKTISGHESDFDSDLCLIVNRQHFFHKDLSPILNCFNI